MCGLQLDYVRLNCLQQTILLNVVHSPPCSWHPDDLPRPSAPNYYIIIQHDGPKASSGN